MTTTTTSKVAQYKEPQYSWERLIPTVHSLEVFVTVKTYTSVFKASKVFSDYTIKDIVDWVNSFNATVTVNSWEVIEETPWVEEVQEVVENLNLKSRPLGGDKELQVFVPDESSACCGFLTHTAVIIIRKRPEGYSINFKFDNYRNLTLSELKEIVKELALKEINLCHQMINRREAILCK